MYKSSQSPSPDRRKVSFQEGPPTEIGLASHDSPPPAPTSTQASSTPGGKSSKWQPLTTVEPSPIGEQDPFSLGDSDDENEKSLKAKAKEHETGAAEHASKETEAGGSGSKVESGE